MCKLLSKKLKKIRLIKKKQTDIKAKKLLNDCKEFYKEYFFFSFELKNINIKDLKVDLCQYLGHNFFRFLRIFFLKFYRT